MEKSNKLSLLTLFNEQAILIENNSIVNYPNKKLNDLDSISTCDGCDFCDCDRDY